jgi:signal transduction histidine kinase
MDSPGFFSWPAANRFDRLAPRKNASKMERSAPLSRIGLPWSGQVEFCVLAVIECVGLVALGALLGAIATASRYEATASGAWQDWIIAPLAIIVSVMVGVIGVRVVHLLKKTLSPAHRRSRPASEPADAELEAARRAERLRIARDLHDALGSTLIALRLELAGSGSSTELRPGVRVRQPRASLDLVDAALDTVKSLIADLRPAPLERFGLWESIEWQANQFSARLAIPCRFSMTPNLPEPSGDIAIAIYRIVEEALTNVAHHASARNVAITCGQPGTVLEVTVRDDGCGIAAEQARGKRSFGLLSMRERARAFHGTVRVSSDNGSGTLVCLRIPIESMHESAAA